MAPALRVIGFTQPAVAVQIKPRGHAAIGAGGKAEGHVLSFIRQKLCEFRQRLAAVIPVETGQQDHIRFGRRNDLGSGHDPGFALADVAQQKSRAVPCQTRIIGRQAQRFGRDRRGQAEKEGKSLQTQGRACAICSS